jgi:hypothetical protein
LAADAAQVFDVSDDAVNLDVLEFVDSVYMPVGGHFVVFSHVILYHVDLRRLAIGAYVLEDLGRLPLRD